MNTCYPRDMGQQMADPRSGDFWDERGALPVEPLNRVIQELRSWTQPTLMLVGNHDQVSRKTVGGMLWSG